MYLIDNSSPFEPGARPSNSSDASVLMCASNASGVMTSSAGLSFSAGLSAAKREQEIPNARTQKRRTVFIMEILRDSSTPLGMTRLERRSMNAANGGSASPKTILNKSRASAHYFSNALGTTHSTYRLSWDGPAG